jgi:hypothetical protein
VADAADGARGGINGGDAIGLRPSSGDDDLRLRLLPGLSDFHPAERSGFQPTLMTARRIAGYVREPEQGLKTLARSSIRVLDRFDIRRKLA